mmetsp:Transcript_117308/g.215912  ORF Transcript_117308/g.215912 Transcript_117308/m.215912 type:complete len:897 (+) Transcript_117308:45-2735(+)
MASEQPPNVSGTPQVGAPGSKRRSRFRIPGDGSSSKLNTGSGTSKPAIFGQLAANAAPTVLDVDALDSVEPPSKTRKVAEDSSASTSPSVAADVPTAPKAVTSSSGQIFKMFTSAAAVKASVRQDAVAPEDVASLPTPATSQQNVSPVLPMAESASQPSPTKSDQVSPTKSDQASPMKSDLPLSGMSMCFTGELEQLSRQEAEEKAKAAGAKVMSGVSGNVGYLVLGSRLDDGRAVEETSKYKKYLDLKSKGKKCPELMSEEKFLAMFPTKAIEVATPALTTPSATSSLAKSVADKAPAKLGHPVRLSVPELRNWVDSHKPRGFNDLLGNASVVRKLGEWLRDWDNVVLKGQKKPSAFKPGGGMPENINARAALLSGPPGIGKTTTARLVAQAHGGFEILEYNASDARGQKVINEMAEGIADNTTLNFGGLSQKKVPALTRRAILIMDEVDGMGAGDRGGNAALIKMIKKTRNPIICICNDQHSQKVRSLAFSCYDLKFSRPTKTNIAQRCAQIAKQEGLDVEPNALEALAESCGGDMRMVLNQLQMLAKSPVYKSTGVKYMDMKHKLNEMQKDQEVMVSPFDACKKLLNTSEGARLSFRERLDMFFVDFSLVGLLIQENYLRSVEKKPVDNEVMQRCAYSADLFTISDILNNKIRQDQDWSLLPDVGVTGAVYPTHVTNGFIPYPSFPSFLGKYSTMSRSQRLTTELHAHLKLSGTVRGRAIWTSGYGDVLYSKMVRPLLSGKPEAVKETFAVLDAYGLSKDHLSEHLTDLRQHLGAEDLFKRVDSKVKAAMTRESNSGAHAVKVSLPSSKKRKVASQEDVNPDEIEEEGEGSQAQEIPLEDKSDDDAGSAFIKVKGKAKAKAKAKNQSSAQEGTAVQVAPKAKGRARGKAKAKV